MDPASRTDVLLRILLIKGEICVHIFGSYNVYTWGRGLEYILYFMAHVCRYWWRIM